MSGEPNVSCFGYCCPVLTHERIGKLDIEIVKCKLSCSIFIFFLIGKCICEIVKYESKQSINSFHKLEIMKDTLTEHSL